MYNDLTRQINIILDLKVHLETEKSFLDEIPLYSSQIVYLNLKVRQCQLQGTKFFSLFLTMYRAFKNIVASLFNAMISGW